MTMVIDEEDVEPTFSPDTKARLYPEVKKRMDTAPHNAKELACKYLFNGITHGMMSYLLQERPFFDIRDLAKRYHRGRIGRADG